MLTAKQTLQWVTRRTTPPWRIGELRSAFQANPKQNFSLWRAITGVGSGRSVIFLGVGDAALLEKSTTFSQLLANLQSSVPSRQTIISLGSTLAAHGVTLAYLSGDWKTAAIVSPIETLLDVPVQGITESNYAADAHGAIDLGAAIIVLGGLGADPIANAAGGALILTGETVLVGMSLIDWANSLGDQVPQTTSGQQEVGSSAGGDPPDGGSGSGDSVLVMPVTTITAPWPEGVDPSSVATDPPVDLGTLPDVPPEDVPPSDGPDGGGGS